MTVGPGAVLSHYRLVEKIGEGGMGVVYRAEDTKLRRQVALKVLPAELVTNEERRLRFLREARTAAAVNHPNIATIHEIDEADGVVFITMELVEGQTLRKQMGGKALPMKDTLRIATEMAEGLAEAHRAHVIHRDLKPDNVIVARSGHSKILDFGLAKLHEDRDEARRTELSHLETVSGEMTREGKVMGTPAYMSPEQARGEKVDARSDIFAFGTTLYEIATGRVPFKGRTTTDTLSAIIRDEPVPASQINTDIPPELDRIVTKCLEKEPQERYQHTEDLVVDLRHLKRTTDSGVQRIPAPSAPISMPATGKRNRLLTGWSAALSLIFVAVAIAAWFSLRAPESFKSGDRVIIAHFEGRSDRPELARQIRTAFMGMLGQSDYLKVLSDRELGELLDSRSRPKRSTLTPALILDLCEEKLCEGFLRGTIEGDGDRTTLTVDLYRLGNPDPIFSSQSAPLADDELLAAIHDISAKARQSVGEEATSISQTSPPTTDSIEAYAVWSAARHSAGPDNRTQVLRRAVEIDPEFVDAQVHLFFNLRNAGELKQSRRVLIDDITPRRTRLTPKLRMFMEIEEAKVTYDFDKAFELAKAFVGVYPEAYGGHQLLCFLGEVFEYDLDVSEKYCHAAYESNPKWNIYNLCVIYSQQGRSDDLERLVAEHDEQEGSTVWSERCLLEAARIRGDDVAVRSITESLGGDSVYRNADAGYELLRWLVGSGQLREAMAVLPGVLQAAETSKNVWARTFTALYETWLTARHGRPSAISEENLKTLLENMSYLPVFATYCADLRLSDTLARVIEAHASTEEGSESRFVREELQFARGVLAWIQGDRDEALLLLEPLALDSRLVRRSAMLARVYESIGRLQEAADAYERTLANPHLKWADTEQVAVPADQVLDQVRLARVYDKLERTDRARHWYERFTEDWKDADTDIAELIEARERLAELNDESGPTETADQ